LGCPVAIIHAKWRVTFGLVKRETFWSVVDKLATDVVMVRKTGIQAVTEQEMDDLPKSNEAVEKKNPLEGC
jgi:hypothetical protein